MSQAENADNTSRLSRRTVLAGVSVAIATGATTLPAAAGADPVYDAIKRERDAFAVYCVTGEAQRRVSNQNPFPLAAQEIDAKLTYAEREARWAERVARPEHKAWWARYKEVSDPHEQSAKALFEAREAFLQTQPTTLAGLFAFLDHIEGPISSGEVGEALWDENERELAFPTLAAALRKIIAA
jgi:hypothetical protein